jgi:SPP1 family predicted phage head-tail adaptor
MRGASGYADIGKMDKRITFQKDSGTTRNDYGEKTVTWIDEYTCWAHIRPLTGNEAYLSKQTFPTLAGKILMRYYAVQPEWRIKYGTRIFKILSIVNIDENGRKTEIGYEEDV